MDVDSLVYSEPKWLAMELEYKEKLFHVHKWRETLSFPLPVQYGYASQTEQNRIGVEVSKHLFIL
jgi:hypothetical protein